MALTKKYSLFFIGNIDENINKFKNIYFLIQDYLWAGPAAIFMVGSFGLRNGKFLDEIEKMLGGKIALHISCGSSIYDGLPGRFIPETGTREIRKGLYLHSFGSVVKLGKYHIIFLGHGQATQYELLKKSQFTQTYIPSEKSINNSIKNIKIFNPDIIISYLFPTHITEKYLHDISPCDTRKERLSDPMMQFIDRQYDEIVKLPQKNRWWFGASVGIKGKIMFPDAIECISLLPLGSYWSAASLEYGHLTESTSSGKMIGNLVYF